MLVGFIVGYLVHEVMVIRQPARLTQSNIHGDAAATAAPPTGGMQQPVPQPGPQPGQGAGAGNPMAEIEQLRAQVAANPNDAEAIVRLASMNYMIRRWDRAAELFERYLQLRPDGEQSADVMSDLGACYRELQQPEKALAMFEKVTSSRPDHWQARFNEVIVLAYDLRRFEQADRVLGELKRLQPNNPDVDRLASEVARLRSNPS